MSGGDLQIVASDEVDAALIPADYFEYNMREIEGMISEDMISEKQRLFFLLLAIDPHTVAGIAMNMSSNPD